MAKKMASGLIGTLMVRRNQRGTTQTTNQKASRLGGMRMVRRSMRATTKTVGKMASGLGGCMFHNTHYDFNDAILSLGASYWVQLAKNILQ
jgi:metal-dependent amidase/aminoacylase/carboxypeptidase family protein